MNFKEYLNECPLNEKVKVDFEQFFWEIYPVTVDNNDLPKSKAFIEKNKKKLSYKENGGKAPAASFFESFVRKVWIPEFSEWITREMELNNILAHGYPFAKFGVKAYIAFDM